MIVLDTSALVEYLVGADEVAEAVRGGVAGQRLAAPHAVDLECAAALRRLVHGAKLPADEAERALELLTTMNIRRYDHTGLLGRVWELRHTMSPYDAACVALAELLEGELVTLDRKPAKAAGLRCRVRNLRD